MPYLEGVSPSRSTMLEDTRGSLCSSCDSYEQTRIHGATVTAKIGGKAFRLRHYVSLSVSLPVSVSVLAPITPPLSLSLTLSLTVALTIPVALTLPVALFVCDSDHIRSLMLYFALALSLYLS